MKIVQRATALGCTLLMASSLLLGAQPASAAPSPPEGAQASAAPSSPRWQCKVFETPSTTGERCVRFTDIDRHWTQVYGSGVDNGSRRGAMLHCKSSQSETMTYSVSSEISAEAGFVFGKLSAKVTAGVQRQVTAGYETSVDVWVPAGQKLACDWGIYSYKARGILRTTMCNASGCHVSRERFRAHAPQRNFWRLRVVR